MARTSQDSLKMLTDAVWRSTGNEGACPPDKYPTFRQLDDLITTTAWGSEAREEFFHRWQALEPSVNATIESGGVSLNWLTSCGMKLRSTTRR